MGGLPLPTPTDVVEALLFASHVPLEAERVRGVNSDAVLENLLERRLVRITGRKEAPGRPYLFETTREFLVAFGLRDVADLPKVEGELIVPELAADAEHGQAETQQDPGAGGADGTAGRGTPDRR